MRVSIYHTKDGYTGIIKSPGVGTDERELTVLDRDRKEIAHSYSCKAKNYFEFIEAVENIVEMRRRIYIRAFVLQELFNE